MDPGKEREKQPIGRGRKEGGMAMAMAKGEGGRKEDVNSVAPAGMMRRGGEGKGRLTSANGGDEEGMAVVGA